MSKETCILSTKDFTILEVMRDRCLGRDDPLTTLLNKKIASALVMFSDDVPENVATLNSRVAYSVNGDEPDTRVISHSRLHNAPVGMYLPITTLRGLALLGLSEGQEFALDKGDGTEDRIVLEKVQYQPETVRREREAARVAASRRPALRLVHAAGTSSQSSGADSFDDPGPSAA